ncbi:UNVERIFIED_ORG: hypothetical protein [Escherichia phage CMSTMSU]
MCYEPMLMLLLAKELTICTLSTDAVLKKIWSEREGISNSEPNLELGF